MKLFVPVAALLLLAVSAFAADVDGKWTGSISTPMGDFPVAFNFKADGATLTGSISGPRGDTAISDGKIDGDTITFTVVREFNGNSMKMNYTGKVSGDQIQFKVERDGGEGRGMEFTAKRASTT